MSAYPGTSGGIADALSDTIEALTVAHVHADALARILEGVVADAREEAIRARDLVNNANAAAKANAAVRAFDLSTGVHRRAESIARVLDDAIGRVRSLHVLTPLDEARAFALDLADVRAQTRLFTTQALDLGRGARTLAEVVAGAHDCAQALADTIALAGQVSGGRAIGQAARVRPAVTFHEKRTLAPASRTRSGPAGNRASGCLLVHC